MTYMFADLSGLNLLFFVVSILISMTIHEAMHGYTAYWLGDNTAKDMGRLTFNPLKSIDLTTTILLPIVLVIAHATPFFAAKPVPFNPDEVKHDEYGVALVGIAGPLTNLVLAIIGAIIFREYASTSGSVDVFNAVLIFVEVNVGFFIFNIIPFPPLDGSRVLYAFAPEPLQEIMARIESFGFLTILIFFFLVFGIISGPIGSIEAHLLHLLLGLNFIS